MSREACVLVGFLCMVVMIGLVGYTVDENSERINHNIEELKIVCGAGLSGG